MRVFGLARWLKASSATSPSHVIPRNCLDASPRLWSAPSQVNIIDGPGPLAALFATSSEIGLRAGRFHVRSSRRGRRLVLCPPIPARGAPMANTAAAAPEEQHFVLSHLSPSLAQRRLALAIVLAFLVAVSSRLGRSRRSNRADRCLHSDLGHGGVRYRFDHGCAAICPVVRSRAPRRVGKWISLRGTDRDPVDTLSCDSGPPLDWHWHVLPRPRAKRTLHQGTVVVLRLPGDFGADPRRQFDGLMLVAQFDLGNDQAVIVARKHVDFPDEVAAGDHVAHFHDDGALPELHQRLGFQDRNIILEFQPAQLRRPGFDRQRRGAVPLDAYPDRRFAVGGQVGLPKGDLTGRELLPIVATHQEFSLDLETHSRSW